MFGLKGRGVWWIVGPVVACVLVVGAYSAWYLYEQRQAPKNIIILIADGWGFNHVEAASYYSGGGAGSLVFQSFPVQYAMSTYEGFYDNNPCYEKGYDSERAWEDFYYVTSCYTDSASAATAMASGVKTYNGAIGVDLEVQPVSNITEAAEAKGKSTGVVTTVQFSHATPAGFVAHNASRESYQAIAEEMIHESATDVIMGTGHPWFDDDGDHIRTAFTFRYVGGEETWDALESGTAGSDADGDGVADTWTLVQTRGDFQALQDGETPKRVIGIAQVHSTLQQARGGDGYADPYVVARTESVPTLAEMTLAALNVLDEDAEGFMLVIEAGAVDWAGHGNQSGRMIEELLEFEQAVKAVVDWVEGNSSWDETLVIVTGDHETGYLAGPGSNPGWEAVVNKGAGVLPGMTWYSLNHTNSLIPFYAHGQGAEKFAAHVSLEDPKRGAVIDNTSIARVVFRLLGEHGKERGDR